MNEMNLDTTRDVGVNFKHNGTKIIDTWVNPLYIPRLDEYIELTDNGYHHQWHINRIVWKSQYLCDIYVN